MRCWDCKHVIVVPDRPTPTTDKYSQTACVEVECSCGARYMVTTGRLPKITREAQPVDVVTLEEAKRGWQ